MRRLILAATTLAVALAAPTAAHAFCGFYINGAGSEMFNDATQVVLMRKGTRTVLSMQNNYKGPAEEFAMVVPVPTVLQEGDVKTLPRDVFARVEAMGAPHDCVEIEYAGDTKLYLPVENIELLSRYGHEEGLLDRLGGQGHAAFLRRGAGAIQAFGQCVALAIRYIDLGLAHAAHAGVAVARDREHAGPAAVWVEVQHDQRVAAHALLGVNAEAGARDYTVAKPQREQRLGDRWHQAGDAQAGGGVEARVAQANGIGQMSHRTEMGAALQSKTPESKRPPV